MVSAMDQSHPLAQPHSGHWEYANNSNIQTWCAIYEGLQATVSANGDYEDGKQRRENDEHATLKCHYLVRRIHLMQSSGKAQAKASI